LATFDGSGSQFHHYYAWEWTSVPGGSAIANAPIPFPDAGATTPVNMTGNVGLWHCDSTSTATATAFPGSIDMTDIEGRYHLDTVNSVSFSMGSIGLIDTYGDGWHYDNFASVSVNGTPVLTNITLPSGAGPLWFDYVANVGDSVEVSFTAGSWPNECKYDLNDGAQGAGTTFYNSPVSPTSSYNFTAPVFAPASIDMTPDATGHGRDGTVVGATLVAGIVGANAYSFDGSNDTIDFGANLQYTTGDFSFSVWLKPVAAQNTWACVFGTHGINGGYALQQRDNNTNRYRVQTGSGGVFGATGTDFALIADIWSHVVITREGTVIKGYVNGNHVYTDVSVATISNALNFVAGNYTQSGWSGYYKGEMDELASWSRALSAAEALAIYNEQVSGQYTPGTGPNEVKGWLFNSPTLTTAKIGAQALDFDGTDQYMAVDLGANAPTTDGTLACWFNLDSTDAHKVIMGLGPSVVTGNGLWRSLAVYNTGKLAFFGYNADIHNITDLSTGTWYHAVVTWANTDDVVVYLNGLQVAKQTIGGLNTPSSVLTIAGRTGNIWNGQVDEAAVWNRALSPTEVAEIYDYQSNSYAGPKTATLAFTPDVEGTYTIQLTVADGVSVTADAVIGTSGPENIDSIFGISKDNIGTIMGIIYGDIDKINDID
jgi:hypothetical protein